MIQSPFLAETQVCVAQWGGTTASPFQVGLSGSPGLLHLKGQESFIPLTNRSLPTCVSPEVVYTGCCLLWGLSCSVICKWLWVVHGLFLWLLVLTVPKSFSCHCPGWLWGLQPNTFPGLGQAVNFLHDTQHECPGPRQQPRGLGAALCRSWSAKGKDWTLRNVHSSQSCVLKISAGCSSESQPSMCFRSVSLKASAWTYSLNKEQSLVATVLREDISCFLSKPLMIGRCPTTFIFKRSVFSVFTF